MFIHHWPLTTKDIEIFDALERNALSRIVPVCEKRMCRRIDNNEIYEYPRVRRLRWLRRMAQMSEPEISVNIYLRNPGG